MNTSLLRKTTLNPVNLLEYGDFSCQRCQDLQKLLATALPLFGSEICYSFRHFPDLSHPPALLMALAAEAARRQDQYWAMHHALFTYTDPISLYSLSKLALAVGINPEKFMDDMHDETLKTPIWADMESGRLVEVVTTPTLFLGTRRLHGKFTQARLVPLMRHYVARSTKPTNCENSLILWSGASSH